MFKFPFGTMNELNLDWIITKVRELIDTAGTTKEKITFETSGGDVQFDGSEAVTIDVHGVDTSGKLDKYTGGTNTLYATMGQNQANIPLPLPADYGGTGCTSLSDLEVAMGLPNSYVARDTTAGLAAYGHDGSNERTIPVEITPNAAGIPYRDLNGNVRTNTPDNNKDAANKEYVDNLFSNTWIHDLKNKQIAIYADSWGNPAYGSLGAEYLESITGKAPHVSWLGSQTLAGIFTNCWDSYNADIYIINGGLNDLSQNTIPSQFATDIGTWVQAIKAVNPSAEIYFILPELISPATLHVYAMPLEMYRIVLWTKSKALKYHIINADLWQEIILGSDNTHPLPSEADKIGKHIINTLASKGDAMTYRNDYSCPLTGTPATCFFVCTNGSMWLLFKNYSIDSIAPGAPVTETFINSLGTSFDLFAQTAQLNTGDVVLIFNSSNPAGFQIALQTTAPTLTNVKLNGVLVPIHLTMFT